MAAPVNFQQIDHSPQASHYPSGWSLRVTYDRAIEDPVDLVALIQWLRGKDYAQIETGKASDTCMEGLDVLQSLWGVVDLLNRKEGAVISGFSPVATVQVHFTYREVRQFLDKLETEARQFIKDKMSAQEQKLVLLWLTDREKVVLEALTEFHDEQGRPRRDKPPEPEAIRKATGLQSASDVGARLAGLTERGVLYIDKQVGGYCFAERYRWLCKKLASTGNRSGGNSRG